MPTRCRNTTPGALKALERWPTADIVLKTFTPDKQAVYCTKWADRCFIGDAPTLASMRNAYGEEVATTWLSIQLNDLVAYSGREVRDRAQMVQVTAVIGCEYGYLKVTELMVFFMQVKAGRYGTFYGKFDPMLLGQWLREFLDYRAERLAQLKSREDREAAAKPAEERISPEALERIVKAINADIISKGNVKR